MSIEAIDLARRFAQLPPEKRQLFLKRLAERGIDFSLLPIVAADRSAPAAFPLSLGQRRLWFLGALGGEGAVHHISGGLRLEGVLDRQALAWALRQLTARHEALRTVFRATSEGEAEQVVLEALDGPLAFEDVSALPEAERESRLAALSAGEARQAFDLERGPLMRATLVRLSAAEHVLLLTLHHLIADGWSVRVMVNELLAFYAAAREGREAELPLLPIQYADYALWQRRLGEAGGFEEALRFWQERLGGEAPALALPFDRPRPAVASQRGGEVAFRLEPALGAALRRLGQAHQATLPMVLMAAFTLLLARLSGEPDLRLGLAVAGRDRRETQGVVGLFVNTLVLRTEVDESASFATLVETVRHELIAAQAKGGLPFEQLVEALAPDRALSHTPLFQVMYNHQPLSLGALPPVAGLRLELFARPTGAQPFDLVLETEERADGTIGARFGYASDLLHEATIERWAERFVRLLEAVVQAPQARLGTITLVDQDELARLSAPYPLERDLSPEPVHRLIAAQAALRGEAPAILYGDETVSFARLEAEANKLAHHLLRLGVQPEERIAVALERAPRQIAAFLAILKAGAAYLPLEADHPPARLALMLKTAGVHRLITESALSPRLEQLSGNAAFIDLDALDLAPLPGCAPDVPVHAEQLAYLIFTSGSTGEPKGVAVAHGPLSRHCQATAELYEMGPTSRELHFLSMAFDGAHERWITPLLSGGAIILRGPELWSAEETLAVLRRHGATHAGFPTAYMQQLAEWALSAPGEAPPMQLYSFGGEAMSRAVFERVKRGLKPRLLINGYGPTEAVISPLAWKVPNSASFPSLRSGACGFEGAYAPIGRAVGERRAYVLDSHLNPVPQGAAGELYLGGDLARGYWAKPALTAERFLPDPFAGKGARLYRTGDRVRQRADGTVEYLGRADAQVKLRGFRIEPGEIEARLLSDETVAAAAVVLAEMATGPQLIAYVVPAPGASPDARRLKASLARALPAYMVPAAILFLDRLPLTQTGKLDRNALPKPATEAQGEILPPETELERSLVRIWQDVLKSDQLGINQNFFEIGGNSLAALEVLSRIRRLLPERKVTIADLFNHQDIRQLAAALTADPAGTCEVVHLRRKGERPMLYCFPGLMVNTREYMRLVSHLGPDQPATGFVCYSLTEDSKKVVSVEGIAANYAAYIREHSRGRPCFLLGWSWGGVLAFEAARMLAGEVEVKFVGMLDVCNLDVNFAAGTLASIDEADRQRLQRRIDAWIDRTPLRKDWENLFARMSPELYTQFLRYLQTTGEELPSDGPGIGSKEYELWTFLDNTLLYRRYRMLPFDVPVHVWLAEESIKRKLDHVDWRRYTPRVERLVVVPGVTHREIVESPAFHASFAESVDASLAG